MKKGIALFLAACVGLSACGAAGRSETGETARIEQSQEVETQTGENRDGERTSGETAERAPGQEQETEKILIAYFTWADNTQVEDPSAVDVDATTSASVLPPGNTAKLAEWIQERVGGDLFSIVTEEPYSSDYDQCLERAADEKAEDVRPALTGRVEHMEQYDTVFLGYPNWWYTVPMPVLTFLEEYDFSGKTVVPFCAHGTGGLAGSVEAVEDALPESARLLEPVGVYRPDVDFAQPVIEQWLDELGYGAESAEGQVP